MDLIDIDGRELVLERHRSHPHPPTWIYRLPTSDDVRAAREHATIQPEEGKREPADKLDGTRLAVATVARVVSAVRNVRRGGKLLEFPAGGTWQERCAWAGDNVPFSWLIEIFAGVQRESDIDDQEEASPAAPGSGDGGGTEDVPVQDVPGEDAA